MTYLAVRYDLRSPGLDREQRAALYRRAVEQSAYADQHGFDVVMLSEHHATDDGYLPSPLVAASAIAARTSRIPISVAALLVNLYDPVRLAEDVAVLDLLSGGRVSYTVGLGYRPEEYAAHGVAWDGRGDLIERRVHQLTALWRGEPVELDDGRTASISPLPASDPHPLLFYGGGSKAAARRAARLGLAFQPQVALPELKATYKEECVRLGREPGWVVMPAAGPAVVFAASDPDAFWQHYGEFLLADARGYAAWSTGAPSHVRDESETVEALRAGTRYLVATPDDLVERCASAGLRAITSHPLCGGMPEEPSWESLRLLSEKVAPALRAAQK